MKPRLRAALIAISVIGASSGIAIAGSQLATAGVAPRQTTATGFVTTLPTTGVADVLVDDVHQQVLISSPSTNAVIVTDLDGRVTGTVADLTSPRELTLSPDGGAAFVQQSVGTSIAKIDTETYEVSHIPLPTGTCTSTLAYAGGKVWFSHGPCTPESSTPGLGYLDPTTNSVHTGVLTTTQAVKLRGLADRPDSLVGIHSSGYLVVYDASGEVPRVVAERPADGSRSYCMDSALLAGGDKVVTACRYPYVHEVRSTADLSSSRSIFSQPTPNAVAVSPDGRYVAAGVNSSTGCDIFVRDVRDGTPGTFVSSYDFGALALSAGTLSFSSTGRLFGVTSSSAGALLQVLTEPARCPTKITLSIPGLVGYHTRFTVAGNIGHRPGVLTRAALTRTDRLGTHDLGEVDVAADGTFAVRDLPRVSGTVTYTVAYDGDDNYSSGTASATTRVTGVPYDVNGDGAADTIVGAPGEDLGTIKDAGLFHVLYGSASGVTGDGSVAISQNTPGVPGSAEAGDGFGRSTTSGDFNGDGFADVAVSASREDIGSTTDAGGVWIFYGSAAGLRTDNVRTVTLAATHLAGTADARFGQALAAGDFDGDLDDDLAIGVPGANGVFIAQGTPDGLSTSHLTHFDESTPDFPGVKRSGEEFGSSLATGDTGNDHYSDLAIGARFDSDDHGYATGSVTLVRGSRGGLTATAATRITKDTEGVPGSSAPFGKDRPDQFGYSVTFGDFDGDKYDDLAVGAPGAPAIDRWGTPHEDGGTVTVLYGNRGFSAGVELNQEHPNQADYPSSGDRYGTTLAAGDVNRDGVDELAVYSPGDTYVIVYINKPQTPPFWSEAQRWTQNAEGIPGSSEPGDNWGGGLRFAEVTGTGHACLIVGAPGENTGAGAFTVILNGTSGLTGTGARYYSQNTSGVPGTSESGDGFGTF